MSFIKTIIASFVISSLVMLAGMSVNFIIVDFIDNELVIISTLALSMFYLVVVWPALQTKLFLYFSRRFNFSFQTGPLFYLVSSFGLVISFVVGLMNINTLFGGTKKLDFYSETSSAYVQLIPVTTNTLILLFVTFVVYTAALYLTIKWRT